MILWSEHIEAAWGQCLVDFRKQPIARRKSPDQYDVLPAVNTKRGENHWSLTETGLYADVFCSRTAFTMQSTEGWKKGATSDLAQENMNHAEDVQIVQQRHTQPASVVQSEYYKRDRCRELIQIWCTGCHLCSEIWVWWFYRSTRQCDSNHPETVTRQGILFIS